jgi:hypothetical protein
VPRKHPADDLSDLRAEIRRLQAREAVLCHQIIAGPPSGLTGETARVEIVTRRSWVLDHSRLPARLLSDPALWRAVDQQVVTCVPVPVPRPTREGWPILRHWDQPAVQAH